VFDIRRHPGACPKSPRDGRPNPSAPEERQQPSQPETPAPSGAGGCSRISPTAARWTVASACGRGRSQSKLWRELTDLQISQQSVRPGSAGEFLPSGDFTCFALHRQRETSGCHREAKADLPLNRKMLRSPRRCVYALHVVFVCVTERRGDYGLQGRIAKIMGDERHKN
jgi:hypothetical protein